MASSLEFVGYAAEQLSEGGIVTYKKLFGEYGLYCGGKFFGVICEDQVFVKQTEAGKNVIPGLELAPPYEGAGLYFLLEDLEDKDLLAEFVQKTCGELPLPKLKNQKKICK